MPTSGMDERTGLTDHVVAIICAQSQLPDLNVRVLFSYARHCSINTVKHFYDMSDRAVWEIIVNDSLTLYNWARTDQGLHEALPCFVR